MAYHFRGEFIQLGPLFFGGKQPSVEHQLFPPSLVSIVFRFLFHLSFYRVDGTDEASLHLKLLTPLAEYDGAG